MIDNYFKVTVMSQVAHGLRVDTIPFFFDSRDPNEVRAAYERAQGARMAARGLASISVWNKIGASRHDSGPWAHLPEIGTGPARATSSWH